ncbi:UNKNOWN [Stylonychia lemnae]|uniref:Uncharacterized protein n=1 Tax=Stylonychia lemnae TaxID=5949 RepID=A0A078AJ85_STYLE|nr:UNKNOWN [Stylonychia lemnae]|eukprot:CDW81547.1 UNKNOWN [Stylonychia lemnae]
MSDSGKDLNIQQNVVITSIEDDRSGSGSNKDSDEEEENQSSQEGSGSGSDEEGSNEDGSEDEEKSGNSDEEEEKDDEEQKVQDTKTSNKDDKSKQHVIDDDEEFKVTLKDQAFDFRKRQNIFDILNEINNDLDQLTVQVDSICQKYVPSLRQSTLKKQPSMNYYKSQSLIDNRDDFMKNKQQKRGDIDISNDLEYRSITKVKQNISKLQAEQQTQFSKAQLQI